jgi:hypothetical protein
METCWFDSIMTEAMETCQFDSILTEAKDLQV